MRTTFVALLHLASMLFVLPGCNNTNATEAEIAKSEISPSHTVQPKAINVSHKTDGLAIGDQAPDFNLENIDGTFYSLADIKDANGETPKGYIVTFTCNTCPFAVKYEDRLIELHHKMAPKGYPLVAIQPNDSERSPGDNLAAMQARAKQKAFPFVYLLDSTQETYPQYGAGRTPEVYLLDSDLILHYHGAVDDNAQNSDEVSINYVENAIEALENGEMPDPAEVKAIGCSIKAKKS